MNTPLGFSLFLCKLGAERYSNVPHVAELKKAPSSLKPSQGCSLQWILSFIKITIFCPSWIFCINFEFQNIALKYYLSWLPSFFWHPLIFCTQGEGLGPHSGLDPAARAPPAPFSISVLCLRVTSPAWWFQDLETCLVAQVSRGNVLRERNIQVETVMPSKTYSWKWHTAHQGQDSDTGSTSYWGKSRVSE